MLATSVQNLVGLFLEFHVKPQLGSNKCLFCVEKNGDGQIM